MNDHPTETIGFVDPERSAMIRVAAGALFVGMLLGIGASAIGRPAPVPEKIAPPTPYSADHARITETAEPIPTF